MAELVERQDAEGTAVLTFSHPPANALTAALRAALAEAFAKAEADPEVFAIVLAGGGRMFCGGLDLGEIGAPEAGPGLMALCRAIEDCPKPVVAALHGLALGGGAELALAAHYRLADPEARIAFPEVSLGLVPHGGATQRLPRILGAGPAAELMLSGRALPFRLESLKGLADAVVPGPPVEAARRFCKTLRAKGIGPRPTSARRQGLADPGRYQQAVATARARARGHGEAAQALVDCLEAAQLLPFEAGLAREADAFETLAGSDESRALRHLYAAERRALAATAAAGSAPEIRRIAVLGGGPLATQLVIAALDRGLAVDWGTRDPEMLRSAMGEVRRALEAARQSGRVDEATLTTRLERLRLGESTAMVTEAQVALLAARGQGAVALPEGVPRLRAFPGAVEGLALRFGTPAPDSRLLELLVGPRAEPAQLARAEALGRALGKVTLKVRTSGPSVTERVMAVLHRACDALIDMGQAPETLDAALRAWGWARPPFEARDLRGLAEFSEAPRAEGAENWSRLLRDAGREGAASGAGFYAHGPEGPRPDAAVRALIDARRPRAAPLPPETLITLLIAVMANEGAAILEEGMVARAEEIDLALVLGQGLPRHRGGPMKAADLAGLTRLRGLLQAQDHPDAALFAPHPLWAARARNGQGFCDPPG
ncbi:enoyl-CoA hydratase-related protein [Roseivivax sp. GX 12232]|uniref:enoyl-CoA hydratase-related protein n=1 Tax=Roseivivax sp. GX 12232 TaxID=2900547 RepID=UPI001E5B431D|nr:enoyl-CoA hydratase-related protein [Roseivivax sp. GX 12232]MCE0506884.1 enoyl-CoA hydratase-related protein [Roseivivax sp. GX 12232]